jgi:hypothetical protein
MAYLLTGLSEVNIYKKFSMFNLVLGLLFRKVLVCFMNTCDTDIKKMK